METRSIFMGLCLAASVGARAFAAPGAWPEPRQNPHLTAIQPMAGAMKTTPQAIAKYDMGRSRPSLTAVEVDGRTLGLAAVAGALLCFEPSGAQVWECHPPGLNFIENPSPDHIADFDGDGRVELALQAGRSEAPFGAAVLVDPGTGQVLWRYDVEPMSYSWRLHVGSYLPGSDGKQIVVVMHGYPPDERNGYIVLFEFPELGKPPVQRWRHDFEHYTCFPSLLQSDLEGDGVQEMVIETHSRMWFFDALSGQLKHFVEWDVSPGNVRSYGLIRFVDLNRDGLDDFLCIADFATHHEVLLNEGGEMKQAWAHGWDDSVTTGKIATTWPEPPYGDLDGDGGYEVVVSMFNSEGENAWLVRAYDALSGELKYRMPGVAAVALGDLDGDGRVEVLGNRTTDASQTKTEGARLLAVRDGVFVEVWKDEAAKAIVAEETGELRVQLSAGEERILRGDSESGSVVLEAAKPKEAPSAPDFSGVPEVVGPPPPVLLAADLDHDETNEILLYRGTRLEVLELERGGLMKKREYESAGMPAIADLDGDGALELVTCQASAAMNPVVEARTPSMDDRMLWRCEFPEPDHTGLPHGRPGYLRTAHFTGKPTADLYFLAGTPVVRSSGIEGTGGGILWEKCQFEDISRYWGPTVNQASTYDYDGDGREDLVFTNPDYYCVASGLTGDLLIGPLFPPDVFSQPSQGLYTLPAILERPEGIPTVALVAGHYFQGAMSLRAKPNWYALPPAGEARCAEEGFVRTEEGSWLLGFGRQDGTFACKNISDGSLRWTLPVEASCSNTIGCDVDGDGATEFVFGTSHGHLYAVGDGGRGPRVLWKVEVGPGIANPIAADVDGDGASEIVAAARDGRILVFDSSLGE